MASLVLRAQLTLPAFLLQPRLLLVNFVLLLYLVHRPLLLFLMQLPADRDLLVLKD